MTQSITAVKHGNNDLLVVNAARVSLGKQKLELDDKDKKLIRFLAKNHHIAPFFHPTVTMMVKMENRAFMARMLKSQRDAMYRVLIGMDSSSVLFLEVQSLYALYQNYPANIEESDAEIYFPESWAALRDYIPRKWETQDEVLEFTMCITSNDGLGNIPENERDRLLKLNYYETLFSTIRVDTSIASARQWFRSSMGFARNELSRRYVSTDPEFFFSGNRAAHPKGNKHGSSNILIGVEGPTKEQAAKTALAQYKQYLEQGMAAECARDVLPMCTKTQWIETASLSSFARLYSLRSHFHAQTEIQELAKMLNAVLLEEHGQDWAQARELFDRGVFCGEENDQETFK